MPERDGARREVKAALTAIALSLNLVLIDAVVKELAIAFLMGRPAVPVIPGLFDLAYVENRGCAWGLLQGHSAALAAFGAAALAFLVWKRRSVFGPSSSLCGFLAEPFLYAGILGNLIDRVFRGHVIDMFDFHWKTSHFPCFNAADAFICLSVGLLLLAPLVERREADGPAESGPGGRS